MKHLYLLLLTILMNNLTLTSDSDDDSYYGSAASWSKDNWLEDSTSVKSDINEEESYSFESKAQHAQDMQELKDALHDQRNEYAKISHYMQTHRAMHPQLSVHIIDTLKFLTTLIENIEPQIDLEILIGINIGLWPKTKTLINAHDENKWIFDWYKQEQHMQSSIKKRTLLKDFNNHTQQQI